MYSVIQARLKACRVKFLYMFVYGECCRRGSGSGEPGTDEWRHRDREAAFNMAQLLIPLFYMDCLTRWIFFEGRLDFVNTFYIGLWFTMFSIAYVLLLISKVTNSKNASSTPTENRL